MPVVGLGRAPLVGRHARGREHEQAKNREEVWHRPWAWQLPKRPCEHAPEPSRWPDMEGELDVARKAGDRFPAVAELLTDHPNDLVVASQQNRRPTFRLMRQKLLQQLQPPQPGTLSRDRKSTRLNSSHGSISYA